MDTQRQITDEATLSTIGTPLGELYLKEGILNGNPLMGRKGRLLFSSVLRLATETIQQTGKLLPLPPKIVAAVDAKSNLRAGYVTLPAEPGLTSNKTASDSPKKLFYLLDTQNWPHFLADTLLFGTGNPRLYAIPHEDYEKFLSS